MSDLEDLAGLLNSKTVLGKVQWTMDDDARLHTIQGKNYIEIWRYRDEEEIFIELSVRNSEGVVLAREYFRPKDEKYEKLDQIMNVVRRKSLGVDEALSDLRSRLEAL